MSHCNKCHNVATACSCATPYYETCTESHAENVYCVTQASVRVANSFNMPGCNESAVLDVPDSNQLLVNGYLWNASVGYLKIVSYDQERSLVTIKNECQSGNQAPGYQLPSQLLFIQTPPPINATGPTQSNLYPYLAADYVAPANGSQVTIAVSNTNGLAVNKNLTIAGGTYSLEQIVDSDTIVIKNNGLGVVPNTIVYARNGSNDLQYPLILIDINPCTNTPVTQGALLVCKNGVSQTLDGVAVGSVPVLVNATTNEVSFQVLQVPTRTCSALIESVTLTPGLGVVTIKVADSSVFIAGNVLQLGTRSDRFTVSTVIDANYIQCTIAPVPGAASTIPVGTSVCTIDCCEDNEANINANRAVNGVNLASAIIDPTAVAVAPGATEGFDVEAVFVNNSPSKEMKVYVNANFRLNFTVTGTAGQYLRVAHAPLIGSAMGNIGTVGIPAIAVEHRVQETVSIPATLTNSWHGDVTTIQKSYTVPVGQELRVRVRNRLEVATGNVASIALNELFADVGGIAVAVEV